MIELSHDLSGGVLVLRPKARIDSGTAKSFEDQSAALMDGGPKKVVIDFSEVDYISSAGLRAVLILAKSAKSAGGALTLCSVRDNVENVLKASGFDSVFGVHAGVKEASAALG